MVEIVEMEKKQTKQVNKLVSNVFPNRNFLERQTYWMYWNKKNIIVSWILNYKRISNLLNYWVAIDVSNKILGTTGLYSMKKDKNEAVWLSWFCVHPEYRYQGIGEGMLKYTIDRSKEYGKKYLRLYTFGSNDFDEANKLYDKIGIKKTNFISRQNSNIVFREIQLM